MKYQIGDSVRIIKNLNGGEHPIGSIGIITDSGYTPCWEVTRRSEKWYYETEDLELITNSKKHSMRKRYMLLKETDNYQKGAIFEEECDDGTQDFKLITPEDEKFSDYNMTNRKTREQVMENPEWFQEVEPFYIPKNMVKKVKKLLKIK